MKVLFDTDHIGVIVKVGDYNCRISSPLVGIECIAFGFTLDAETGQYAYYDKQKGEYNSHIYHLDELNRAFDEISIQINERIYVQ